jgi:hypothetical protein
VHDCGVQSLDSYHFISRNCTVRLVKNAHCNTANMSDGLFVLFPNGFGLSILQPASSE